MKNYFEPKFAAERYAMGRPYFHELTIGHIQTFLKIDKKFNTALDIACGTGLSTKALLKIANNVYGTDSSEEMLRLAAMPNIINYSFAIAEQQPFAAETFDLITVCSGVHWFHIDNFLVEANRILKSNGWLILYENLFLGEMIGQEVAFRNWLFHSYLNRFPSPPRNNDYDWTAKNVEKLGFQSIYFETFKNIIQFNAKQLATYFTTQSNITNAIENDGFTYEEVEEWLEQELGFFFKLKEAIHSFQFGNWIRYLRKD